MTGDAVLGGLMEVFPQFKDDIDAAADYIIQNVVPNIVLEPSHQNVNGDLYTHGNQQVSDDKNTHVGLDSFDNKTNSNSLHFDLSNKTSVGQKDILTGLCLEVFDIPSTSGQNCLSEEFSSGSLLAGSLMQNTYSERNPELSSSGGDMPLHDDASPHNSLMSNVVAISEMLQEVERNEENTKHAILEASQAGIDILGKVEELKEMTTLAVEENNKVEGENFAEKSILAAEAQELQCRLSNISEETKSFVLAIDKLRELLTERGHVVDALHGEMLGIFDSITKLNLRVDIQIPVDEQWQHIALRLSSSVQQVPSVSASLALDVQLQQISLISSRYTVDEALQQISPVLSCSASDELLQSDSSLAESLTSESNWSSAVESRTADVSYASFGLDDSWDLVDDDETTESPGIPMLV